MSIIYLSKLNNNMRGEYVKHCINSLSRGFIRVFDCFLSMTKISVIGMGSMGSGMLMNLTKHHEAVGFDDNRNNIEKFVEKELKTVNSLEEALSDADIVILSISENKIRKYLPEFVKHCRKGSVIVNTTTLTPGDSRSINSELESAGIEYLACPIRGVRNSAVTGTLAMYVGGRKEVYESIKAVLDLMTRETVYLGNDVQANAIKLLHNFVSYITTIAYSEAFAIAGSYGIKAETVYNAFKGTRAMSETLKRRWEDYIEKGDYDNGYSIRHVRDDMELVSRMVEDSGASALTPYLTKHEYDFLPEKYLEKDMSAVLLHYMEKHGLMKYLPEIKE